MLVILTDFPFDASFIKEQQTITLFIIKDSGVHFHNTGCMKRRVSYIDNSSESQKRRSKVGALICQQEIKFQLHYMTTTNPIFRTKMLVQLFV